MSFAGLIADAVFGTALATDALYLGPGETEARSVRVVLSRDVERLSMESELVVRQTEAGFRRGSDVRRGGVLTVGAESWRLSSVVQDDSVLVTYALIPIMEEP